MTRPPGDPPDGGWGEPTSGWTPPSGPGSWLRRSFDKLFGTDQPNRDDASAAARHGSDSNVLKPVGTDALIFIPPGSGTVAAPGEGAAVTQPVEHESAEHRSPISVLIVDDDPIVRTALSSYVQAADDLVLAGVATDGSEVLRAPRADVVLMDVQMPVKNGIDATKELLARDPTVRVLMLTSFDTDAFLVDALQAGAAGFLLKATTAGALVEAIRGVSRGNTVMSAEATETLLRRRSPEPVTTAPPNLDLSAREREVLRALCSGQSNAEMAAELYLSESTIKTHVSNIMVKLGAPSRLKVVVKAHEWNLLDDDQAR